MALPTITQTWTISPNNRYIYGASSSLILVMGNYLLSLKNFLKTTMGYTVKGSCDGTTGAMDGVDRWSTAANADTRFNGAGGAQSWFVLTDGNGMDHCLSYNAASDDIYRLAYSPGGNYVVAGTANQQPTATDEVFDTTNTSWINATTSVDRVWHLWGSADKKMWRALVCRQGSLISIVGVEKLTSALVSPATFSLATGGGTAAAYKFYYNATGLSYVLNTGFNAGYSATNSAPVSRVHTSLDVTVLGGGSNELPTSGRSDTASWTVDRPELQGQAGMVIVPTGFASQTANGQGKLGTRIDWWTALGGSTSSPNLGETFGNLNFLVLGPLSVWPWDALTVPVIS